jgi:hypothetical protein
VDRNDELRKERGERKEERVCEEQLFECVCPTSCFSDIETKQPNF